MLLWSPFEDLEPSLGIDSVSAIRAAADLPAVEAMAKGLRNYDQPVLHVQKCSTTRYLHCWFTFDAVADIATHATTFLGHGAL
jgi:hypothetical protein